MATDWNERLPSARAIFARRDSGQRPAARGGAVSATDARVGKMKRRPRPRAGTTPLPLACTPPTRNTDRPMVRVTCPQGMQRHLASPPLDVAGRTVREALEATFVAYPQARGYLLDDQGALRLHVAVFVDGAPVRDRIALSDAVRPESQVHILQALSGG